MTTPNSAGLVAPGLIDLQINGAYGWDFTTDPASIWKVGERLPEQGVTAFLPTIITAAGDAIDHALSALNSRPYGYVGAEPLGLHLEGPMISADRRGVHNPALMQTPSLDLASRWGRGVSMVTLAPELPGAESVVKALTQSGVVVSAGHSAATYEQALAAFGWGVRAVTHLFNAMEPFEHRAPGLVGAAFDSKVVAGLICDGIHAHPGAVRTAWRLLGPDRLALVTDAMAAAGLGDGTYRLSDIDIQVQNGRATDADGRLAGSTLMLDQAIRNLMAFTGCDAIDAIGAASTVPASLLGAQAPTSDVVVFDHEMKVVSTEIGGELVWQR